MIGSNVFNLLMILGVSSCIDPYQLENINMVDYGMAILAAVLMWIVVFTFGKKKFDRIEGLLFLAIYIGYTTYLLMR